MGKLRKSYGCPTEFTLTVLGGKWKTVILCYLKQRSLRYSELKKLLPSLSDKVLVERLRDLQASGLIHHRKSKGRASPGIYSLSPRGRSLGDILHMLYVWGHENAVDYDANVHEPLGVLEPSSPADPVQSK
jgi:DNA-binding HxlR family transcriptional regulator